MKRGRSILIGIVGIGLLGAGIGEYLTRLDLERRYREAVASRQELEMRFGQVIADHGRMTAGLERERQRSRELSEALVSTRTQLEETVGRLSSETRNVNELKTRLSSIQQQMDQLQGELAMTIQERPDGSKPSPASPVELERIVVSSASAPTLQGRIVSVHQDWDFVVIDLGWDAVRIGDIVSIMRDEQVFAKARVERVQQGVCAASVLPEWKSAEVRINDLVRVL